METNIRKCPECKYESKDAEFFKKGGKTYETHENYEGYYWVCPDCGINVSPNNEIFM